MDSTTRDILSKLDQIRSYESSAYSRLQDVINSVGSGVSLISDHLEDIQARLDKFHNVLHFHATETGIYQATLPAEGGIISATPLIVTPCREHQLIFTVEGGASPSTVGVLLIQAMLNPKNTSIVSPLTICSNNIQIANGYALSYSWKDGGYGFAGNGFTSAGMGIGPVACETLALRIYISTTFNNGPWLASLYYQGRF